MSGGISYALKVITERIPPQILNRVFVTQKYGRHFNEVSVESIIFDKVVAHTVIRDCGLRGHNEATIPLSMDWIERYEEPPRTIIAIPEIARQMLPIISVLSVGYSNIGTAYSGYLPPHGLIPQGASQMQNYARMAMDSVSAVMSLTSTATYISPDGGSIILLDAPRITQPLTASVILGQDSEMSALSPRQFDIFSKLCVAAVKMYIYNNYDIEMDRGELAGGQQIGRFAERLREYADAEEEYDRILNEDWYATEIYSNPVSRAKYFMSMIVCR